MRMLLAAAAFLFPVSAIAQTYACNVLQHWRNSAMDGAYIPDSVEPIEGAALSLNFRTGEIRNANPALPVQKGQPVIVPGANTIGLLSGGQKELTVHTIFPRIADPQGGVLGSIMRIDDNDYMPKGTMMSRLSCKRQ